MSTHQFKPGALALAIAAALLPASQALAAEYWLKAVATTASMPNPDGSAVPVLVPMWGYQSCTGFASADTCAPASVPGPALNVPAGETTLTVHLQNNLPAPTSLVVNGLHKPMAPVFATDDQGRRRVRSFDKEVAAGATEVYAWTGIKPGTYLYQSGTQPQVQVQMGLYGAVMGNAVDASPTARAQAYAGVAYDNQATLLYSEIDPALHAAVADNSYGTTAGPTSTFNYQPKYFLINGQPYPGNAVIAPVGAPGTTLLRLLNAGLTTHVPMIDGLHWNVVAEDGKPYTFSARQYTALLPAAKTLDVVLTPAADLGGGTRYAILDRRLNLSNSGQAQGGMLAFLGYGVQGVAGAVGAAPNGAAPTPVADSYAGVKDVSISISSAEGVLLNDTDPANPLPLRAVAASGATALGGSYQLSSSGAFTYTPPSGVVGADTFSYVVTDGRALSAPALVTVTVQKPLAPANMAVLDDFTRTDASSLGNTGAGTAWSQQVGTTTSVPDLGIAGAAARSNGVTLGGLALLNQPFAPSQAVGFSATPFADSALVLKASGGSANAPANYVRVRCEAGLNNSNPELVIATILGGSNVSVAARQAGFATTACAGGGTLAAAISAKGLVTAFVNGAYVGGVQLPEVSAWTGAGKLGIQLQTLGASIDNFSGASY
ncbi:Ig-like domain-containing protein [Rhodoferax lacus]|nr:Ig-like domain-containing protein [Rhodoferax lacus]